MRILPRDHRKFFKDPFGTLYPDIPAILPLVRGKTIFTVGDVVTYRLIQHGVIPDLAVVDGHTMRSPCDRIPPVHSRCLKAKNPPGAISSELIETLKEALGQLPAMVLVEGEEDLAVIPLVMVADNGAFLVYGQPGEGVVLREIDAEAKDLARKMFEYFFECPDEDAP